MMKKKMLSMVLALCMVMSMLPSTALATSTWDGTSPAVNTGYAFSGGDGSIATPYLISTAADLAQLSANVNAGTTYSGKFFKMTDNIALNSGVTFTFDADTGLVTVTNSVNTFYLGTGIKGDTSGANTVFDTTAGTAGTIYSDTVGTAGTDTIGLHSWTPIGTLAKPFRGNFYGEGHVVSGVYINNAADYQGLFGYAAAPVYNVGVSESYIFGDSYVGGVAGYGFATFKNCYNTGIICGSSYIGGIMGYCDIAVYNSYNAGTVTGTSNVGGITGNCHGQILYCYSTSTVTGTSNVGSVVGYNDFGFVLNCGTIDGTQKVTAGTVAECGGTAQTLLTGLTSGTSTLLEALNGGVNKLNSTYNYTWKADSGSTNGGYPVFDAAYVKVPDAPTIGTATAGDGQATITFMAPASNGGAAITGYTVTSNPGGFTAAGVSSPITVTGLTNDTAYTFTVTATNSVGTGAVSPASNSVTPTLATAPTITSATYDCTTGTLVATGTDFVALPGATNDIVSNRLTLTGEGGATYTLTASAVEITSGTAFTVTLIGTDLAGVNQILNKNGISSTGGTTYNLAAADNWVAGADAAVDIADATGNGITVSNVVAPTYTMSASSLTAFASQTVGYGTPPAAQTVTITNTGNQAITLTEPATTNASSNYTIGALSTTTLAVSGTATFTVRPNTGLAVGTYDETINIAGSNSATTSVSAQFSVTAVPTYAVSAATDAFTANDVTATATFGSSPYAATATATITITLSGTAAAAGTHTIGLTSAKAGVITPLATVTKTVIAKNTQTDNFQFTFTMPSNAVDDLVVTNTFAAQEATPSAAFEASTMTVSNISTGMKYSVNGGSTWVDITTTSAVISGVTATSGIKVYKPGNGSTTTDSDVQTITVTKAATPIASAFTVTQPSAIGGTGSIAGITSAMEYNSGSSWTAGTGVEITGISGGTIYLVRVKASGTVLASENYSTTINAFVGTQEATPMADFEASTMTLSNISTGMKYSVDGGSTWVDITTTSAVISGVTATSGIKIYKPGNGSTTTDSDMQTIAITKAATPIASAFTVTQPSAIGGTGSIAGITSAMEYNSGSSWTAGGSTISSIVGGTTYDVRVKGLGTVLSSDNYSIPINTFGGTQLSTPNGLAWDGATPGKATWTAVPNTSSYTVQLYKGSLAQGGVVTGITNADYDFTSLITETGSYTFKVTAIGDAVTYINSIQSAQSAAYSYTAPANASITPATASFDKYNGSVSYADVSVTKADGTYTLSGIKNGSSTLTSGTDYTISGDTVIIKMEYLATLSTGTETLVLDYSGGIDPTLSLAITDSTPVSGGSRRGGSYTPRTINGADITINGNVQTAGTVSTTTINGRTTTTITVDDTKLDKILDTTGNNATVTIPSTSGSDVVVGVLNGQTIKHMETREAVLEIKTGTVTYTLPASQINIDAVSGQLGDTMRLKDIKISVSISESASDTVKMVEDIANTDSYQIVVRPIEFEIICTSGGKTVDVSRFNGYVERMVAIPDGIEPGKISTGVVLNADGTFSPVPTTIVLINGKYYAKINSLTNSTYLVIYNPIQFSDVAGHWARDAMNEMGSRLIITGDQNGNSNPDNNITRAEFAAMIVRALGLSANGTASFTDGSANDWYYGAVGTAYQYGIVDGKGDNTFDPNASITREEAMVMVYRASKLSSFSALLNSRDLNSEFSDYETQSVWAEEAVAFNLNNNLIKGSDGKISPKAAITRAEVATVVLRLLQRAGLVDIRTVI